MKIENHSTTTPTGKRHEDERGFFQEILRENDKPFKQVSIFSINPGQQRGHHYHKELHEAFVCIEGTAYAVVEVKPGDFHLIKMTQGRTISTMPQQAHAFFSEEGAKLIALSSKHFDPNAPDTYPSKETKLIVDGIMKQYNINCKSP